MKRIEHYLTISLAAATLLLGGLLIPPATAQSGPERQDAPRVLATIKPLQLIAAAVLGEAGQPELLMRPGADPHHYAMRPSERRALEQADVLLWVGPALEGFLADTVSALAAHPVTALDLPELVIHELSGQVDPHVWLDADNARTIARALAARLAQLDPDNADRYRQNLETFDSALSKAERDIDEAARALPDAPAYGVYHNAFQYFEKRHGLAPVASFVENEELKPGIRQLLRTRETLRAHNATCVLLEPSVNPRQLHSVLDDPDMRYQAVDVLGRDVPADANGYPRLLRKVADAIFDCLAAPDAR